MADAPDSKGTETAFPSPAPLLSSDVPPCSFCGAVVAFGDVIYRRREQPGVGICGFCLEMFAEFRDFSARLRSAHAVKPQPVETPAASANIKTPSPKPSYLSHYDHDLHRWMDDGGPHHE